jgi:uncharacterized protein
MTPQPPAKMLMIFVDETDQSGDLPLYEAILRKLVQMGMAGATVNTGIMGYGSQQHIHRKRLFGMADDRPVTITVVESEAKIRAALAEVRPMVEEGLVLLMDCEVVP